MSHNPIVPSAPATARLRPSGAKATARAPAVLAGSGVPPPPPAEVSQSRAGPSVDVAARVEPSGLNATARTRPGRVKVAIVRRSATRRRITVPSEPAVASVRPSGAKATALTGPSCPPRRATKGWDWVLSSAPRASIVAEVRYA